jgi:hypothetical protein
MTESPVPVLPDPNISPAGERSGERNVKSEVGQEQEEGKVLDYQSKVVKIESSSLSVQIPLEESGNSTNEKKKHKRRFDWHKGSSDESESSDSDEFRSARTSPNLCNSTLIVGVAADQEERVVTKVFRTKKSKGSVNEISDQGDSNIERKTSDDEVSISDERDSSTSQLDSMFNLPGGESMDQNATSNS